MYFLFKKFLAQVILDKRKKISLTFFVNHTLLRISIVRKFKFIKHGNVFILEKTLTC